MARTMSIADEESGVTASIRVEEVDGQSRVTVLHFAAVEGFGITAEHLHLLQNLGFRLPAAIAPPPAPSAAAPVPMPRAPERVSPPRKSSPAKQQGRKAETRKRYTGGVPSDAVLLSMWARTDGSVRRMAEAIGASTSAVTRWLGEARHRGVTFTVEVPAVDGVPTP